MKRIITIVAIMLCAISTTKAIAQAITPYGYGLPHATNQPQVNNAASYVNFKGSTYLNSPQYVGAEITTSRNYLVLGLFPLLIDSAASRNDTLRLSNTYLYPGQIINVLCNGSGNDTVTILHDNSFNGATATYLLSPATTAAVKRTRIYVDKNGSYWTLQ